MKWAYITMLKITKFKYFNCIMRVFWLNIAKFEVNWCYRYCFNLFSKLRKESELRQYHCRNSTKVGERKIKSRREKFFIFGNGIAAIPSAHSYWPGGCSMWSVQVFFVFVETFKLLPLLLLMRVVETERSFYCSIGVNQMWTIKLIYE